MSETEPTYGETFTPDVWRCENCHATLATLANGYAHPDVEVTEFSWGQKVLTVTCPWCHQEQQWHFD